jgi:hypothetical protein
MYRLVFQSYPNNEIRIGFDQLPYSKERKQDSVATKNLEAQGRELDASREKWECDNNIIQWRDSHGTLWRSRTEGVNSDAAPVRSNLVITSEVQESSNPEVCPIQSLYAKPVSRTRFTRNGRHRLLEAGAICEERRGAGTTGVFVTFTLPGSTLSAYDALARCSGYVANCVCQCIRDYKWSKTYFWVWERQKRGALHLHLFIELGSGIDIDCYREPLRSAWYNALIRVGERVGVDMFRHADGLFCTASHYWRYDYQEVRKSVGGYLSKYVSKEASSGFSEVPTQVDVGYYPRRWWYMSRDLTTEINNRRKTICVEGVSQDEIDTFIHSMDAMATLLEPVLQHVYIADIGRTKYRDGSFGHSYRRLYWFDSTDYQDIELVLRSHFLRATSQVRKVRVTFKGFALDYGGERLPLPRQ